MASKKTHARRGCGIFLLIAGIVLVAIGGARVPLKAFRTIIQAVVVGQRKAQGSADDQATLTPTVTQVQWGVWNFTNVAEATANPNVQLRVKELLYTLNKYSLPAVTTTTLPSPGVARTLTLKSALTWYVPTNSRFETDHIVVPDQTYFGVVNAFHSTNLVIGYLATAMGWNATTTPPPYKYLSRPGKLNQFYVDMDNGVSLTYNAEYAANGIDAVTAPAILQALGGVQGGITATMPNMALNGGAPFTSATPKAIWNLMNNNCSLATTSNPKCNTTANTFVDVSTGETDIRTIGQIVTLGGSTNDSTYGFPFSLSGVSYTAQGPPAEDDNGINTGFSVWNSLIKRAIPFSLPGGAVVTDYLYDEIKTYQYEVDPSFFAASTANLVYNQYNPTPNGVVGVWGVTPAPKSNLYFISKAHFLDADASLRTGKVSGYAPDPALHDTTVDLEPITGLVLAAKSAIQMSLRVDKSVLEFWLPAGTSPGYYPASNLFSSSEKVLYLPLQTTYTNDQPTKDDANAFYTLVVKGLAAAQTVCTVLIVVGAILFLPAIYMIFKRTKAPQQPPPAPVPDVNPHQIVMQTAQPMMVIQQPMVAGQVVMGPNGQPIVIAQQQQGYVPVATVVPQYQ
ncbi:Peptidase A1 domain-containing protein [Plasmodiophora brassicae]